MEVFRGKYNHAGFFKSKKEKRPFQGSVDFSSTSVRQGRNLLKAKVFNLYVTMFVLLRRSSFPLSNSFSSYI